MNSPSDVIRHAFQEYSLEENTVGGSASGQCGHQGRLSPRSEKCRSFETCSHLLGLKEVSRRSFKAVYGSSAGGVTTMSRTEAKTSGGSLQRTWTNMLVCTVTQPPGELSFCGCKPRFQFVGPKGNLVLVSKERLFMFFKNCILLLRLLENRKVFFLTPRPRYLQDGCCPKRGPCSKPWLRGFRGGD